MNLTQLLAAVTAALTACEQAVSDYSTASQDVDAKVAATQAAQAAQDASEATLTEKSNAALQARLVLDKALDAASIVTPPVAHPAQGG